MEIEKRQCTQEQQEAKESCQKQLHKEMEACLINFVLEVDSSSVSSDAEEAGDIEAKESPSKNDETTTQKRTQINILSLLD